LQTFLPYKSFEKTAECLDYRRLGKQRVEALQIFNALTGVPTKSGKSYTGWLNHPAVIMWKGYEEALLLYKNKMIEEWILRGYNNTMDMIGLSDNIEMPRWLGNSKLHASHRSNLLRKDYEYYSKFNWEESDDMEYYWDAGYIKLELDNDRDN
jgi:hypothetical protein|tara:strand:+ start:85 stop:543 length:459 start_codon:yes stop_codon:yes gene_type:complete